MLIKWLICTIHAPPRHAHGDLTSLAPHERLPEPLPESWSPLAPSETLIKSAKGTRPLLEPSQFSPKATR